MLEWSIENHTRLYVRAFITRYDRPLGECAADPQVQSWLGDPASRCKLQAPDDALRSVVRDALREHGFKPTGRSKPSSEYLLRASSDGALRAINPAVDAGNAISLKSGLPISVIDLGALRPPLQVRYGAAGESYVFNPTGQVIAIADLPCLYDAAGPCANAVKDAQRTKTCAETRATLSIVWSTHELLASTEDAWQLYRALLTPTSTVEDVSVRDAR